jgi:hypothetical protein
MDNQMSGAIHGQLVIMNDYLQRIARALEKSAGIDHPKNERNPNG